MRIFVCQLNPTIGDIKGNKEKILQKIEEAKSLNAELVIFPELALTGYPPRDLLLRPHFIAKVWEAAQEIEAHTQNIHLFLGLPRINPHPHGKPLFNSCAIFANRFFLDFYDKMLLPNYDVFDERRYFEPGNYAFLLGVNGKKIAITICEDLWEEGYANSPVDELKNQQIDLLVNMSASPFYVGKEEIRRKFVRKAARTLSCPVLYVNQVGGNDTLVFDGQSFLMSPSGAILLEFPPFEEYSQIVDLSHLEPQIFPLLSDDEKVVKALELGLRDFCHKQGFKKVVIGLSGGIDSSLVAVLAVSALGKENVIGVLLPSRFTSDESIKHAKELADRLGIANYTLPLEAPHEAILQLLKEPFKDLAEDVTEENIQSRLRGLLLMAFANKFNALLLNTGNKSEYAVGYCTLYGDMCGALSVIGDLTKKEVYHLARHLNIPKAILEKEPTAELKPNQKDSDSLPPYVLLDRIVSCYVEENLSPGEIATKLAIPLDMALQWCRKIDQADFKRIQAAPILNVTQKSLSFGRNFPIVKSIHT